MTASIGVLCLDEIKGKSAYVNQPEDVMYHIAMLRANLAKSKGRNLVCSNFPIENYEEKIGKILIVDTDTVIIDVIKTYTTL